MKTNFIYTVFLFISLFAFSQTNFDLEKSKVKWTGKKITNASHWGHINFTKADITFDGDVISRGKIKNIIYGKHVFLDSHWTGP